MSDHLDPYLTSQAQATEEVIQYMWSVLSGYSQPSAWELLEAVEQQLGAKARWVVRDALMLIAQDANATHATREYARHVLESDELTEALSGKAKPGREIQSSIDALIQSSQAYRKSGAFQEMIGFMANFKEYAPFNNMLVKVQNPSCGFYATQRDWQRRFKRWLIEDAKPMLILAPMHPVMLVYDLDQTVGEPLPAELLNFAAFRGKWDRRRLDRLVMNAWERDRVRVDYKRLSSTNAGFVTHARSSDGAKMRIAIHDALDSSSQYGVLCHELAHIYLGHLGGDSDGWWPSRGSLSRHVMEVEAEATAFIAAQRAGLTGASPQYISRYLKSDQVLQHVSVDQIAKVAGRIDDMSTRSMSARRVPARRRAAT